MESYFVCIDYYSLCDCTLFQVSWTLPQLVYFDCQFNNPVATATALLSNAFTFAFELDPDYNAKSKDDEILKMHSTTFISSSAN